MTVDVGIWHFHDSREDVYKRQEVEELICETATVINGFPRDQQGAGLINARAAVASVMENRL